MREMTDSERVEQLRSNGHDARLLPDRRIVIYHGGNWHRVVGGDLKHPTLMQCELKPSDFGLPGFCDGLLEQVLKERELELGGVLMQMIELLTTSPEPMPFGRALELAAAGRGVTVRRGSAEEEALLKVAFQIMATRKIPGAAEA